MRTKSEEPGDADSSLFNTDSLRKGGDPITRA